MNPERLSEPARSVGRRVADELIGAGARAVVLVGSHARAEAGPESDLDILAVGTGTYSWRLDLHDSLLVSTGMKPYEAYREDFGLPERVCKVVPGWREAVVLHDPEGLAASLIKEATEWAWEPLARRCNAWVAEEITGYAEEVHKLAAALKGEDRSAAAVQRALLAMHLATVLAVHLRILCGSENRLWDLVSDAMGEGWREAQSTALGLGGESFEQTCVAALGLYGLAAEEVASLLDERQKRVVESARGTAQSASL